VVVSPIRMAIMDSTFKAGSEEHMKWFARHTYRNIIAIVPAFVIANSMYLIYAMSEAVCFWDPWIETKVAPGFSESTFKTLHPGMSTNDVALKLRQPFAIHPWGVAEAWYYTAHVKRKWTDFAWLGRWVVVSNGVVTEVHSHAFDD
jgi:hypothetical protein